MKEKNGIVFGEERYLRLKFSQKIKSLFPIILLLALSAIVVVEQIGVRRNSIKGIVEFDKVYSDAVSEEPTCIVFVSSEPLSLESVDEAKLMLQDMKVSYDICDLSNSTEFVDLSKYKTAVVTFQDFSVFGSNLDSVVQWIYEGGGLMTMFTPQYDQKFKALKSYFGIAEEAGDYPMVDGIKIKAHSMIGAQNDTIISYEEPIATSIKVSLDENSSCYITSKDGTVPLLWKTKFGDGTFVINNMVITDKYERGIWCFSYSLLEPVCIYPVINASSFYLDDFPAPVPGGSGEYIKRDYGVDVASFFSTIWWPQVVKWENEYNIKHTGVIIESYDDQVKGEFPRNYEINQYITYGNVLLNGGGELGFHGYNHQPLCIKGINDEYQFAEYKLWKDEESIYNAVTELQEFSTELFPENKFQVYVPPSNIISEEGIEVLKKAMPDLRVIASTYLKDSEVINYVQEFGVEEDGTINAPRITSGCSIDDYAKMTALSELNFHYAQSHFIHPDDVLDEDRGAKDGWKQMAANFEIYLNWLRESVPNIRQLTGSEFGVAVQDYSKISVVREKTNAGIRVKLGGFSDEASFLMRISEGKVQGSNGCELEEIYDDLYLVTTKSDEFDIFIRK